MALLLTVARLLFAD